MAPPSAKKIRANRTYSPAVTTRPAAFQTLMNQRKNTEYYHLNQEMNDAIKAIKNHGNPSTENGTAVMQSERSEYLREYCHEYRRRARNIDLAYDITSQYCGKVIVMGNNESSQLMPVSTTHDHVNNSNVRPTVNSLVKSEIRAVAAGGLHTMTLSTKGIPYTWGVNDKGALGRIVPVRDDKSNSHVGKYEEEEEGAPGAVTGFTTTYPSKDADDICEDGMIHQIAAGVNSSLFLSIHGNVYMCGGYIDAEAHVFSDDDSRKVVDVATKKDQAVIGFNRKPVHVYQLPKKAVAIAAGGDYNAALLDDDTVVTWGMNDRGALARTLNGEFGGESSFMETVTTGTTSYQVPKTNGIIERHYLQPKPVEFAHNPSISPEVIAIACGLNHLLVVARNPQSLHGNLYSSGMNNWGQLGHGDRDERRTLTLVEATEDENFVQVAAGEFHSMALTHDSSALYSFGRGDSGQLGIGERAVMTGSIDFWFPTPQLVKFDKLVEIASIDAGESHSSAITIDGELYTWGFNEEGATGHQTGILDPTRPTLLTLHVEPDRLPVQFAGGGQHSVLLVGPKSTE